MSQRDLQRTGNGQNTRPSDNGTGYPGNTTAVRRNLQTFPDSPPAHRRVGTCRRRGRSSLIFQPPYTAPTTPPPLRNAQQKLHSNPEQLARAISPLVYEESAQSGTTPAELASKPVQPLLLKRRLEEALIWQKLGLGGPPSLVGALEAWLENDAVLSSDASGTNANYYTYEYPITSSAPMARSNLRGPFNFETLQDHLPHGGPLASSDRDVPISKRSERQWEVQSLSCCICPIFERSTGTINWISIAISLPKAGGQLLAAEETLFCPKAKSLDQPAPKFWDVSSEDSVYSKARARHIAHGQAAPAPRLLPEEIRAPNHRPSVLDLARSIKMPIYISILPRSVQKKIWQFAFSELVFPDPSRVSALSEPDTQELPCVPHPWDMAKDGDNSDPEDTLSADIVSLTITRKPGPLFRSPYLSDMVEPGDDSDKENMLPADGLSLAFARKPEPLLRSELSRKFTVSQGRHEPLQVKSLASNQEMASSSQQPVSPHERYLGLTSFESLCVLAGHRRRPINLLVALDRTLESTWRRNISTISERDDWLKRDDRMYMILRRWEQVIRKLPRWISKVHVQAKVPAWFCLKEVEVAIWRMWEYAMVRTEGRVQFIYQWDVVEAEEKDEPEGQGRVESPWRGK